MKKLLIPIFIGISLLSYAQSFQLTDPKGNPYTNGQTIISATITEEDLDMFNEFVTEIVVENLTGTELDVQTLRTNIDFVNGMNAYVCFGTCCDSTIYSIPCTVEESEHFSLHLKPNGKFGFCKFKLDFTAAGQSMTLYVEIEVKSLSVKENTTVLLSAYPNPVSANSTVNISYTLADKNSNQNLVIRNIMGAVVMNMPLNPYNNVVSIETSILKSGVYFYTIENNNQISAAKKLIVK